jgi:hypothetical protein
LPPSLAGIRRLIAEVEPKRHAAGLEPLQAGQLQAAGLINAALDIVVQRYGERVDSESLPRALASLDASLGQAAVDGVLAAYAQGFDTGPLSQRKSGAKLSWPSLSLGWPMSTRP